MGKTFGPAPVVFGNCHQPDFGPNRIGFYKLWRNPYQGPWWFLKRPGKVERC